MAVPALDLETLKRLDATFVGNRYDDETFRRMLPTLQAYLEAVQPLRQQELGEVRNFWTMLAGGNR